MTYEYDAVDRPTQVIDSSAGVTTITYDARDQVAEVAEPAGTSMYDYDANGRVVSTTAAGQPARQYAYDATGLLAGVAQDGVSVELAHDAAGRLSQVSLPGGWTQSYTYDANNLVSDLTYEHDGQVQGDLSYTYLPDGQPGSVAGSYARVTLPEARSGMEYDAQNRLVTSGGAGIDYDADGNMLDDGMRAYEWDELGRLTSVTTDMTSTDFGYSPTGERSSRDDGADRTEFLDIGPNPAVEFDANGQVNAELLSGGMDQWFSRTHAGGTDAVLTDLLGSPVALGSADGTLAAEYAYDPFGAATVDTFVDEYNHRRPHRSLPHRQTPATAYQARPKATPNADRTADTHDRVRHDRVSTAGTITLRHNGTLYRIGIGKTYARTYVLALVQDLDIRIIDAATGEILRDLTLDPTRIYQGTGRPLGPTRK